MEKFLYYPYIETTNDNWLKYALLYLDKLSIISPPNKDKYLSNKFKRIKNDTDLILLHKPDYNDAENASNKSIDLIEKILKHPERYSSSLNSSSITSHWKNKDYYDCLLFNEKFTEPFKTFCCDRDIAKRTDEGLKLSSSLNNIYMSFLANYIANRNNYSSITDNKDMDRFVGLTDFNAANSKTDTHFKTARGIIDLKLPSNLDKISFEKVLELRNKPDFSNRRKAFNIALAKLLENFENGEITNDFLKEYEEIKSDFISKLTSFGFGVFSIVLGVYLSINTTNFQIANLIKDMSGLITFSTNNNSNLKKIMRETKRKKLVRNYLIDLNNVK